MDMEGAAVAAVDGALLTAEIVAGDALQCVGAAGSVISSSSAARLRAIGWGAGRGFWFLMEASTPLRKYWLNMQY